MKNMPTRYKVFTIIMTTKVSLFPLAFSTIILVGVCPHNSMPRRCSVQRLDKVTRLNADLHVIVFFQPPPSPMISTKYVR